jgi:hypothetical protein
MGEIFQFFPILNARVSFSIGKGTDPFVFGHTSLTGLLGIFN